MASPNTFTNINNDIVTNKLIMALKPMLAPLRAFCLDLSDEARQAGDIVTVRVPTIASTVSTKVSHGDYSVSGNTLTRVQVTLGEPTYVGWSNDDVEQSLTSTNLADIFAFDKAHTLAKSILNTAYNLITSGNFSTEIGTYDPTMFDKDDVIDIRKAAVKADIPVGQSTLILDNDLYASLLKSLGYSVTGDALATRAGDVGRLVGFREVIEANTLSDSTPGTGDLLGGFVAYPSAIAMASRYLAPGEGNTYSRAEPLVDQETGVTLGLRSWYDNDSGVSKNVIESVFGASVSQAGALKRILKTA